MEKKGRDSVRWDFNCDLGEGESPARTRALMRCVTSANVACGGHAGDAESMEQCVRWAKHWGVRLGAHPGPYDRVHFGRGIPQLTFAEFELLLLQQVGALQVIARAHGVPLHHIKLHGGLYHWVEASKERAEYYLEIVSRRWPRCRVYAFAGGQVVVAARRRKVTSKVWGEAFVDRGYRSDGSLVPRSEPGALILGGLPARQRLHELCEEGQVTTTDGKVRAVQAQTLCLHADTPTASRLAQTVSRFLKIHRR